MKYTFSETASLKVLLHTLRHPSSYVCGVVLAQQSSSTKDVSVVDAIPLFHTQSVLGPCFETAMVQVIQQAEATGRTVAGFYEASAMMGEPELSSTGTKLGNRLAQVESADRSRVFVLDSGLLGQLMTQDGDLPLQIYTRDGERWKRALAAGSDTLAHSSADLSARLHACLADKVHYSLWDFDDHLDDLSRDWMNTHLPL